MKRALALIAAGLLAIPPAPVAASAMPEAPNCPIYPTDSVWHARIDQMPVHPMSDTWLLNMGGATRTLHPDFGGPYGYEIEVVDNTTPVTRLTFDYADESDDVMYPFTASTPIEQAGDAHAFMLDRDTCVLYELFDASWDGGRPRAGSGAVFDLKGHALRPAGWTSADAAGLPIWPGVLRYDEVFQKGLVDHAIRFTAQQTDRSYVWPARHQAGARRDDALPPMGARFRLKNDFPVNGFSPQAQAILMGMKRHGLILADNGSNWFFQGQTDTRWPDSLISELKRIPSAAFEAVDASSLMIDPNSGRVTPLASREGLRAGWRSTWQGQSPYLVMQPGQVADVWVRFSNSGTQTWQRGVWGRQANLGLKGDDKMPYAMGMAVDWLWDDRIATTTAPTVAPGEIAEFRFKVRAPMARGLYRLELQPVIDGTTWMDDQGVFWLFDVR